LDQQDIKQIREIVREEISGTDQKVSGLEIKTSKIEKNVSSLQQDVSVLKQDVTVLKEDVSVLKQDMTEVKSEVKDLRRHMIVLHEDTKNEFKLLLENIGGVIKESVNPVRQHVFDNHEPRISTIELAVKRKKSA
jgi:chromosome segregation ATPase